MFPIKPKLSSFKLRWLVKPSLEYNSILTLLSSCDGNAKWLQRLGDLFPGSASFKLVSFLADRVSELLLKSAKEETSDKRDKLSIIMSCLKPGEFFQSAFLKSS
jgi:hypothetical protein